MVSGDLITARLQHITETLINQAILLLCIFKEASFCVIFFTSDNN